MKSEFINLQSERGVYIALYGLVLVMLAFVFGLALDGGNLYLTQLRLQRAVDAGALSGAQLLQRKHENTDVPNPENDFSEIQAITDRFVRKTFAVTSGGKAEIASLSVEQGSIPLNDDDSSSRFASPVGEQQPVLKVSANVETHLFLLSAIPGMKNLQSVRATAAATIGSNKVFTVLVIDTSDSMRCDPVTDATTCRIVGLQKAVTKFLDEQIVTGDYISVITFDAFAQRIVNPTPIRVNSTTKQEIKEAIANLWKWNNESDPAAGLASEQLHFNTNIYDGLRLAFKQIEDNNTRWTNISKNIALFTDGAPSIGWQQCQWQPLQQPYAAFSRQINEIRLSASAPDCRGDALCEQLAPFSSTIFPYLLNASYVNPDSAILSDGCPLPSISPSATLEPSHPIELSPQVISDLTEPDGPESGEKRWEAFKGDARPEHCDDRTDNWTPSDMYHAAINIADRARMKGVLIYAFAIGQDSSLLNTYLAHSVEDDPYQGGYIGAAFDIVQTNFLRRIANDPGLNPDEAALRRLNFDGPCVTQYPLPPFDASNPAIPPEINAYRRGRFFDASWSVEDSTDPSRVGLHLGHLGEGGGTMARLMRARLVQ